VVERLELGRGQPGDRTSGVQKVQAAAIVVITALAKAAEPGPRLGERSDRRGIRQAVSQREACNQEDREDEELLDASPHE
jgi:hypothetical protein